MDSLCTKNSDLSTVCTGVCLKYKMLISWNDKTALKQCGIWFTHTITESYCNHLWISDIQVNLNTIQVNLDATEANMAI